MTPPARAVVRHRSLPSRYQVFLPALIRSTPFLPAVQGKSLGKPDLNGTTDTNIGTNIESGTLTGMMGGRKRTIGEVTMNPITMATLTMSG
jgi:hypothetical protein